MEPQTRKYVLGGAVLSMGLIAFLGVTTKTTSNNNAAIDAAIVSDGIDAVSSDAPIIAKDTMTTSTPNIFLFTVDDMGWNDVGYNSGDLPEATPYMKTLAKKGITLTHYYSQPSCTPSRVAMMTGKYVFRNGFQNYELQHNDAIGVPLSNKMMPAYMKEVGYRTIGFGKWNIGHCNSKYLPSERGFDRYLGYLCPGHGYRDFNCGMSAGYKDMIEGWTVVDDDDTIHYKWETGSQYEGTYDTEIYRVQSTMAIKKHFSEDPDIPLFMWLAQHGIHGEEDSDPVPPENLLTAENKKYLKVLKKRLEDGKINDEVYLQFFKMRMITASVLMSIDNSLKQLVTTLEDAGKLASSVIFVNSDNGGDTYYKQGHPGNNYPLRSEKFSYFEGGVRVPAFVFAPGRIPESRVGAMYHGLMHHVDLIGTFVHLGGGDASNYAETDSINHWEAIIGDTTSPRTEIVLNAPRSNSWKMGESDTSEGVAMRVGNYKMLTNHAYDGWFSPGATGDPTKYINMHAADCEYSWTTTTDSSSCNYTNYLFNVIDDPNEETNLWDDSAYDQVRTNILSRFYEILEEEKNDYGQIVHETYKRGNSNYLMAFAASGDYVVPFDCEVIQ